MFSFKGYEAARASKQQSISSYTRLSLRSSSCRHRSRRAQLKPKALSPSSFQADWPSNGSNNHNSRHDDAKDGNQLQNGLPLEQQRPRSPGHPLEATWHAEGGSGAAGHASSNPPSRVHGIAALIAMLVTVFGNLATGLVDALDSATGQMQVAFRKGKRFAANLSRPEARMVLETCHLGASLLFILLYIWSTYTPVVAGSPRWWLDLVLSAVFAADYTHRILVSSSQPLLSMLHPLALIDLLSWAPSLLGALMPMYVAPWGLDLRWFRVFRALRLLRLSLLSRSHPTMKSNRGALIAGSMNVPLVWLFASVISWLFTSASCVAVMEKLAWHDALYFVTSTLTTVGYGDVVVKSSMGRLVVLVMMLIGVVLIPVRASQLYSRFSERPLMSGHPPGDAPGCKGDYVVLSGRLSDVRGFNDFLQDFLVQVHSESDGSAGRTRRSLQLVCLCNKPSAEFLALQELHESHLTLVEGSAFSDHDLNNRAALAGSTGVMVLADRFSTNATAEDTDVQFRVWAIKSAVKRVPLYVQVLRRQSVDVIAPFLDPYQDVISSIEGTRLRLLALSCFVPGASTLIANLLRSSGPNAGFTGGPRHTTGPARRHNSSSVTSSPTASMDDYFRSQNYNGTASYTMLQQRPGLSSVDGTASNTAVGSDNGSMAGRRWLREYADGAHCELFWCVAGAPLAGLRFSEAAEAIYQATGAMPVGLVQESGQRLHLNPSSCIIKQGQQLVILATSQAVAEAGAAGDGVEHTQILQSLRAAAVAAAAGSLSSNSMLRPQQQQGAARAAAAAAAANGGTRRGVTVRVPGLSVKELAHLAPGVGTVPAGLDGHQEVQQFVHQQHQQVLQQDANRDFPQSSQPPASSASWLQQQFTGSAINGQQQSTISDTLRAADLAPAQLSRDLISQPGSSSGGLIIDQDDAYSDEELALLNPCIANWSGAYESDSIDETEICTDSEMLEAALLQRQRQQLRELRHQQHQLVQQYTGGRLPQSHQAAEQGELPAAAAVVDSSRQAQALHNAQAQKQPSDSHQQPLSPQHAAHLTRLQQWHQQREYFGSQPHPAPQQLTGHVIIAGSASEFLPFAEQLHAIAPPESAPVTLVILHPELPPDDIYQKISNLGPTYYVRGKPSESAALAAAGAKDARSLVYLGPSERPTHLSSQAVSGVYGDPTVREVNSADYNSTSRTAVLADADALSSCYGVGEVLLPDTLHTVVELGFTSSIRFLQPGLLLHGRSAPHSNGSFDDDGKSDSPWGSVFFTKLKGVLSSNGKSSSHSGDDSKKHGNTRSSSSSSQDGPDSSGLVSHSHQQPQMQQLHAAAGKVVGYSSNGSIATAQLQPHRRRKPRSPQQQQQLSKQPRSSWRHRKEIEQAGREEGLTEWQLNNYYAAGRVMVPALLDTFTVQGFFKRRALLDLLTELAGDDGRPGGAMLRQLPVPTHLVGCTYKDMVTHFLTSHAPHERYIPLGLIRRKSENRAWRLPYVATHPDPDTVLQMTDAVFVIRPQ